MRNLKSLPWLACVALSCALAGGAKAMTSKELVEKLKQAGAGEAVLVQSNPLRIEEKSPDFLGGAKYLRVTVLHPHRPHLLHYVYPPDGGIYRLKLGQQELERMQTDLGLEITSEETALRYAQWLLEVTEGPAYWPVSSVDDVPFLPAGSDEAELRDRIARARLTLTEEIVPPSVELDNDSFRVTQLAVKNRDLVRYEVTVGLVGKTVTKRRTLRSDIPVVYVQGD